MPNNLKAILFLLDQISKRKRIPKKKRYVMKDSIGLSGSLHAVHKDKDNNVKGKRYSGSDGSHSIDINGKTFKESAEINEGYRIDEETENKRLVNRLLPIFNKENNSAYVISDKPREKASIIDILIENPETKQEIGIQTTHSDEKAIGQLRREKSVSREGDLFLICSEAIKKRIGDKSNKYPLKDKKETILALDGWFGVTRAVLERFKVEERTFLKRAEYLQIWFVGKVDDDIVRLY